LILPTGACDSVLRSDTLIRIWPLPDPRTPAQGQETFGVGFATHATRQSDGDAKGKIMKQPRNESAKVKETCTGVFAGYQVSGWRFRDAANWYVKVWPVGRPGDWMGYTLMGGKFELNTGSSDQKEAILHVIRERVSKESPLLRDSIEGVLAIS
jgi:hypothetical protein